MLLETSDIKRDDILIFSENQYDLENNFKIVNKKGPSKKPATVSFYDIGKYINLPVPKSLIVYRLLTNQPSFNANITKHGFLLSIEGNVELVYFDPVYAIKDIDLIKEKLNFDIFRFKIQQVGLTSLSKKGKILDFTEIFSFDLRADEAKSQNDRVYAEAIFAFEVSFTGKEDFLAQDGTLISNDQSNMSISLKLTGESFVRAKIDTKDRMIIENEILTDKTIQSKPENAISEVAKDQNLIIDQKVLEEKDSLIANKAIDKSSIKEKVQSSVGEFLQKRKQNFKEENISADVAGEQNKFMNLFKSTTDLGNYLRERAKESFILKIEK